VAQSAGHRLAFDKIAGVAEGKRRFGGCGICAERAAAVAAADDDHVFDSDGVGVVWETTPGHVGLADYQLRVWIGIGHAGHAHIGDSFPVAQRWRTAVNRAAEAMTIFAVMCAVFSSNPHWPGLVWLVAPAVAQLELDLAAVPLAADVTSSPCPPTSRCRCCSGTWAHPGFGVCATGQNKMRSSSTVSSRWRTGSTVTGAITRSVFNSGRPATPLVCRCIRSFPDFSVSQLPGWHTTDFPRISLPERFTPVWHVLTLLVPLRKLVTSKRSSPCGILT